jgi:hypothetical protein
MSRILQSARDTSREGTTYPFPARILRRYSARLFAVQVEYGLALFRILHTNLAVLVCRSSSLSDENLSYHVFPSYGRR